MTKAVKKYQLLSGLLLLIVYDNAASQKIVDLYQEARQFDPVFLAAQSRLKANIANAEQFKGSILPVVNSTVSGQRLNYRTVAQEWYFSGLRKINSPVYQVVLKQPIYRPANLALYEQGEKRIESAQIQYALSENNLILRLSEAYIEIALSQENLKIVEAEKNAASHQLLMAKRNYDLGFKTITDVRESEANYAEIVDRENTVKNEAKIKSIGLKQIVGKDVKVAENRSNYVEDLFKEIPEIEFWMGQAEQLSLNLQQAKIDNDTSKLEVKKAEAGHKPTVDFRASYEIDNNPEGTIASPFRNHTRSAIVGVDINIPIFNGFVTENKIKEAVALQEEAHSVLESTRLNVIREVSESYLRLIASIKHVEALKAIESANEASLAATMRAYQLGMRINIDVINAQNKLFKSKRDLSRSRYEIIMADLRLRNVCGVVDISDMRVIDD